MMELSFLCEKKILAKLKLKTTTKIGWVFSINISDQEFENSMDLLLAIDENKSRYVFIKNFNRFMFHKAKNKKRKLLLQ